MSRDSIDIELEEPVQAHGEKITSLVLRPPSGQDLITAGWPFTVERNSRGGGMKELVDWNAARILLSCMAQVPTSTIDAISAMDKYLAIEAMKLFFLYRTLPRSSPT